MSKHRELIERIDTWLNCTTDDCDEAFTEAFQIICEAKSQLEADERALREVLNASSKEIILREEYPQYLAVPPEQAVKNIQGIAKQTLGE